MRSRSILFGDRRVLIAPPEALLYERPCCGAPVVVPRRAWELHLVECPACGRSVMTISTG